MTFEPSQMRAKRIARVWAFWKEGPASSVIAAMAHQIPAVLISPPSPRDACHELREAAAGIDRVEHARVAIRRRHLPERREIVRRDGRRRAEADRRREEVDGVEDVQELAADLEPDALADRHALDDAHVEAHEGRTRHEMIDRRAVALSDLDA